MGNELVVLDDTKWAKRCGARTHSCRQCKHRYTKEEFELWECPECGEPRACRGGLVPGANRCKFHGGASLRGLASPTLTHGRYSRSLPTRLQAKYLESIADEDLLAMNQEMALLDARIGDILTRVDIGEAGATWKDLTSAFLHFERATARHDNATAARALTDVKGLIQRGQQDWDAWTSILTLIEQRRKLVETERRRRVDMKQMMNAETAMLLVSAILSVIREHVTDRRILTKIGNDVSRLISERNK